MGYEFLQVVKVNDSLALSQWEELEVDQVSIMFWIAEVNTAP